MQIGRAHYLSIEGEGDPDSVVFSDAIGALYAVAFTVKMARKFAGTDYAVAKLEALWWVNLPDVDLMATPRGRWHWKLMIRIPEFITSAEIVAAIKDLVAREKPHSVKYVRRISVTEGKCVQVLHLGPYTEEAISIGRMRTYAAEHGFRFAGTHHEIYLSDPRRVAPEKLRTILRQPIGANR